jgi:hypothetical protein
VFKKSGVILILILLSAALTVEGKVVPVPDVMKPDGLYFDKANMYITEDTSIYVYSLKDFKLVKKFGQKGQGPREFSINPQLLDRLFLNINKDNILIHSFGKLSWFTKDGGFIEEKKLINPLILFIQPLGKNFVGTTFTMEQQTRMQVLNLYDKDFNKIREIARQEDAFQPGKGLKVLTARPITLVYDNKIFMAWEDALSIRVMDENFKELYTIKHEVEKIKVTEKIKNALIEYLKSHPATKDIYPYLQPIQFPTYFPAMIEPVIDGDKIYILTFKTKDNGQKNEFLILSVKGKLLSRWFFPLKWNSPVEPYPFRIHQGYLYQLADEEDVDKENWMLHVSKIE